MCVCVCVCEVNCKDQDNDKGNTLYKNMVQMIVFGSIVVIFFHNKLF